MASPNVAFVSEGGLSAAATNVPIALPSGGSATDEYIVIIAKGSAVCSINALAGWTELLDEAVAAGLAIIRYTGAGVPTDPTFVQSVASRSVWCAYRITGANKAIAPEVGVTATGTSTTPDPPARAVTGGPKDILAIACFAAGGEIADDDSLVTTFPTNYTLGRVEKAAGTVGTNLAGILGAAASQVAATSSENPGTFLQNASRAWRANTIVVHPVVPKQTSVGRISLAAGGTPPSRTLHQIKARARVTGGAGTLRAALYEGATNRSGDLESSALTGTLADYTLSIPDASAANITSYADLEIRFWGYSATGEAVTVEIDQLYLEAPAPTGPTTYFGVTAMPITFGKAVAASRKTFSQTALPLVFGKDVAGVRKAYSQVAFPITFAKDVSARRKTFSQSAFPIIFAKDVGASRKTFGQVAAPFTFGEVIAGQRKTFSSLIDPITFGAVVQGRRKTLGATALPITFAKDVSASRKTFGQTLSPFIFGKAVAATRKTFGQTAFPITFGVATAGYRPGLTFFGVTALPITFSKEVNGQRKALGQIAFPLTFGKDVRGVRKTFGVVTFPIIFTKDAVGRKTLFGLLSMQTLFGKETAARRKTFGQVLVPIVFSKAVAGRKQTFGQVARPINFTAFVDGFAFVGPKTYFGNVVFPVTFGKQVTAFRKTFGQVTAPYIFGEFTQGQRKTYSQIDFSTAVLLDAETGRVETHGQVSLPIIFDIDSNGIIRPLATILNLAEAIYLGNTPVLAVYTEDQLVWP